MKYILHLYIFFIKENSEPPGFRLSYKSPFDEGKVFMLEVWNKERNYDYHPGSMLAVDPQAV